MPTTLSALALDSTSVAFASDTEQQLGAASSSSLFTQPALFAFEVCQPVDSIQTKHFFYERLVETRSEPKEQNSFCTSLFLKASQVTNYPFDSESVLFSSIFNRYVYLVSKFVVFSLVKNASNFTYNTWVVTPSLLTGHFLSFMNDWFFTTLLTPLVYDFPAFLYQESTTTNPTWPVFLVGALVYLCYHFTVNNGLVFARLYRRGWRLKRYKRSADRSS